MATKRKPVDETTEILRTLLIVQLALAGIAQHDIRAVAGCDMHRVTRTLKALKLKGRGNKLRRSTRKDT